MQTLGRTCIIGVAAWVVLLGQNVPDFHVNDLADNTRSFSSLRGDVTVVTFISTTCPISNLYADRMSALYRDFAGKGVRFIFVNSNRTESAKVVADNAKAVAFPFAVYKDAGSEAADALKAEVTPESYVIDHQNQIVYRGQIDDNRNEARVQQRTLRLAIEATLAGQPVPQARTKAFGCVIKRARRVT